MRHPRLLIGLLVLATILVDVVVWSILAADSWPETWWHLFDWNVLFWLVWAQVSLVAIWAGFGGKPVAWRLMGLGIVISLVATLLPKMVDPPRHANEDLYSTLCMIFFVMHAGVILCLLAVARLAGVGLVTVAEATRPRDCSTDQPRLQFSLGYLFSWMTALAVLLGLLQWTIEYRYVRWLLDDWPELVGEASAGAAVALAALWAVLGTGKPVLRIMTFCMTTLAAIVVYSLCSVLWWCAIVYCLGQVFWLLASLLVCRVAGYRVVWRRRTVQGA